MPVKPDGLPEPVVNLVSNPPTRERFALPRKLICMNASGSYTAETHQVSYFVRNMSFKLSIFVKRVYVNIENKLGLLGTS